MKLSPAMRRAARSRVTVLALLFLGSVVVVVVSAPLLTDYGPEEQDLFNTLKGPSGTHWLGTDELGRDQFTRLLYGGRTTLLASLQAVGVAVVLALPLGVLSGYLGGAVDAALNWLSDAFMSIPALVLAVTVVAALGPGLTTAMLAVGIIFAPVLYRIVRGAAIQVQSEIFIEASRAIGCSRRRILIKHVLPNIMPPLLVQLSLLLGTAMLAEASLSFLGLGVRQPTPSWGGMLQTGFANLYTARFLIWPPGIAIASTVLAFSLLGDGLRDSISAGKQRS